MTDGGVSTILEVTANYPLHRLGWKAFQDLCVAAAEECLRRPVQNFLPGNDAGRDGAFVGRWDGDDPAAGEATIQCKFTSLTKNSLTVSKLSDELDKAHSLAANGLAADYVILTNHQVAGANEIRVRVQTAKGRGDNGLWRIAELNGILYLPDVGSKTILFPSAFASIFASN